MRSRRGTMAVGPPPVTAAEPLERRSLLSTTVTTLATFDGTNGTVPAGELYMDAAGDLYGLVAGVPVPADGAAAATTTYGIWELPKGGAAVRILARFDAAAQPYPVDGLVADAAGNLYGSFVDAEDYGTPTQGGGIWEYTAATGQVTTRATFDGADGQYPAGTPAVDAAGDVFGAIAVDGTADAGYAWELPAGSGQISRLASFDQATGDYPGSPVYLDSSGALYGATGDGGARSVGTIWKLVGHTITVLTSFVGVDIDGAQDLTSDGAGHLFGDGPGGASGAGAAFELDTTAAAATPKVLVSFNGNGPSLAQLTISGGAIYGTLERGGTDGAGEVAEIDPVTGVTQAVAYSPADALGQPVGKVVVNAAGDLFGTASVSGTQDPGSSGYQGGVAYGGVYEVTPATVAAAADPPHLVFTAAPTAARSTYSAGPDGHTKVASAALGTFRVTVEDSAGQTSDADDGSDVTLTGGAGFGFADSGVLTVSPEPVVDGVATFTDAVVTYAGDVTTAVDDGIYSLRADDDIDYPGYSTGVTVDPPVPTSITVTPTAAQSAVTGMAGTFAIGTFAVADAPGPYTVSVDWGDGTADTTLTAAVAGAIGDDSHTYAAAGGYTVSVVVTDATGDTSAVATFQATVADPPPPPPPASPLAIAVLTRPAAHVVGGTAATATVRVTAASGLPFDGTVSLVLLVSPDASAADGVYAGGASDRTLRIGRRRSVTVRGRFTYPTYLPTGTYRLAAEADVSGSAPAAAVADGTIALTEAVVDLSVRLPASVAVSPGRRATVTVRLVNAGTVTAAGAVTLTLYASASGEVDAGAVSLATVIGRAVTVGVGRATIVRLAFYGPQAPAPGAYDLIAVLTPASSLVDDDPADNTAVTATR